MTEEQEKTGWWLMHFKPLVDMDNALFMVATVAMMLTMILSAMYVTRTMKRVGEEAASEHKLMLDINQTQRLDAEKRREAFQERLDGLDRTIGALKEELRGNQVVTEELRARVAEKPARVHEFPANQPAVQKP